MACRNGVAYDLNALSADDVNAIARIYDGVVVAIGEAASTRSVRAEVLARLLADARSGRLDPFVSRERLHDPASSIGRSRQFSGQ